MRTALFTYDGPHPKSSSFFVRLLAWSAPPEIVIAAPWRDLGVHEPVLRTRPRGIEPVSVRTLCARLGIDYVVVDHDADETTRLLASRRIEVGVIGGARILRGPALTACTLGILNVHPGMLPRIRGLDALKWSILDGVPPGVTAHLIDDRVDAGRLVHQERLTVYPDETLPEIGHRLDRLQGSVLDRAMDRLSRAGAASDFPEVRDPGPNRGRMDAEMESEVSRLFPGWLERTSGR